MRAVNVVCGATSAFAVGAMRLYTRAARPLQRRKRARRRRASRASSASTTRRARACSPSCSSLPGRMERVGTGDVAVFVDYAHTPDALEQLLRAGARDRRADAWSPSSVAAAIATARNAPLMGRIATELADRAIVTSDNPRGEDPAAIAREIVAGARPSAEIVVEPDRRTAIRRAIGEARARRRRADRGQGARGVSDRRPAERPVRRSRRGARRAGRACRGRLVTIARDRALAATGARVLNGHLLPAEFRIATRHAHAHARRHVRRVARRAFRRAHLRAERAAAEARPALLVEDAAAVPEGVPALVVGDTRTALLALGGEARRAIRAKIVAITGSTGKTTTKDLLAQLLRAAGRRVAATPQNENNEIGVAKLLLGLERRCRRGRRRIRGARLWRHRSARRGREADRRGARRTWATRTSRSWARRSGSPRRSGGYSRPARGPC